MKRKQYVSYIAVFLGNGKLSAEIRHSGRFFLAYPTDLSTASVDEIHGTVRIAKAYYV
jgi:hypothetical protein